MHYGCGVYRWTAACHRHRVAGSQVRGFRADIIVENKVIVELKCVEKLNNTYKKQLLLATPHWDEAGLFTEF